MTEVSWFNPNGVKMTWLQQCPHKSFLLRNKSAFLSVARASLPTTSWIVAWRVTIGPNDQHVSGQIIVGTSDLRRMFDLANNVPWPPHWMKIRFHADDGKAGVFIRTGQYLNVPGPGTGYDGDANVSVLLTSVIKEKMAAFILAHETKSA